MIRKTVFAACMFVTAIFGMEIGASWLSTGQPGIASPAEARRGRPLTPVSVAGVGRRTARRCVAGVYSC